jgi:hypothetical protein
MKSRRRRQMLMCPFRARKPLSMENSTARASRPYLEEEGRLASRRTAGLYEAPPHNRLRQVESGQGHKHHVASFSAVRLEGWPFRRGLPSTVSSLSLLPAFAGHRLVSVRPFARLVTSSLAPHWVGPAGSIAL